MDDYPKKYSLHHVHGHQDKNNVFSELPIPSQLDVLMDQMSKDIVDNTYNESNVIIPFPAQSINISHNQPLVQDITTSMIMKEKTQEIGEFYFIHHGIPKHLIHAVEWNAIKKAFAGPQALSYKKTFHNLRNTMKINKRWGWAESDRYPLCQTSMETLKHLLQCPQSDMSYVRSVLFDKFLKQLKGVDTHPLILSHWMTQLHNISTGIPFTKPDITLNPNTWRIMQAHKQQEKIGWDSFFRGTMSKKWTEIQLQHYRDEPSEKQNIY